jgi:23S rRNA (guanosine2251-2'-O)-methyltransferase
MKKLSTQALGRLDRDSFSNLQKVPVYIVLDNIRSALNVGSVFRTADAFAIKEILLVGMSAVPPHKEILKTALGSTETVDWKYFQEVEECLEYLEQQKATICAVEQTDQSMDIHEFIKTNECESMAFIFGNEVNGVSDSVLHKAQYAIEIPQFGTKHSLNVAVCAGIVCYELARKCFELPK